MFSRYEITSLNASKEVTERGLPLEKGKKKRKNQNEQTATGTAKLEISLNFSQSLSISLSLSCSSFCDFFDFWTATPLLVSRSISFFVFHFHFHSRRYLYKIETRSTASIWIHVYDFATCLPKIYAHDVGASFLTGPRFGAFLQTKIEPFN